MDLDYPEFNETPGAQLYVVFNPDRADMLFKGSGHTFQEFADLAKTRKPLPTFPLPASIASKARVETKHLTSANLVAKLPGTDPALKDEYVVLSAHIDHVGIGEPIQGRSHLQRRDGQRLRNGLAARCRQLVQEIAGEAATVDPFRAGNRRRKRTAWIQVFCGASDRPSEIDSRGSE